MILKACYEALPKRSVGATMGGDVFLSHPAVSIKEIECRRTSAMNVLRRTRS